MDEDEFGDDDLDTIPDNTLQQLEHRAVSSTPRPQSNGNASVRPQPPHKRIQTYGAPGLSRNNAGSKGAWKAPQPNRQKPSQRENAAPPASAPDPPSSDYGFDEEDVVDLDEPSMVIQPASGTPALPTRGPLVQPTTSCPARHGSKAPLDPETEAAFAAADAELGADQAGPWGQAPHLQPKSKRDDSIDVSALQARIAELEAESNRLRRAGEAAQNAYQQKSGEIAIVRANQGKATREYERRITVMQKLHADEAATARAELESGKKEREKMETNNRFLQHDLAQETEKAKRVKGTVSNGSAGAGASNATPKKGKRQTSLGDGFADEEIRLVSPSRSRDKSGEQTPKAGTKRKRPAQDSPLPALSFTQPPEPVAREDSGDKQTAPPDAPQVAVRAHDRYTFMQRLLNHSPYEGHENSLEALSKHYLPSNTSRSLNSMLLTPLSSPAPAAQQEQPMCIKLCSAVFDIWSQCLAEQLYSPIYLLLDLIRFALRLERARIVVQLVSMAVPICTRTIDLVASPTVFISRYPMSPNSTDQRKVLESIEPLIDSDEILDFLQILCDAAFVIGGETQELFWNSVDFTFVLVLLNKALRISQITTMLRMLGISCLATTFGPICEPIQDANMEIQQTKQEEAILDRLTCLLFETPEPPADEPAYRNDEVAELRVEIVEVIKELCLTDHGCGLLVQNWSAIGRLVRFLHGQVSRLYSTRPSLALEDGDDQGRAHDLIAQTVNTTMKILYHLLHTYANSNDAANPVDLMRKLKAVKGGYHKFLVSFTRIAFSDQLVLEHGIEDAAVEAAHTILDGVLSPEEGEAIMKAVETPRGTRSAGETTEKDTSQESAGGGAGGEEDGGMEEDEGG